MSVDQNLRVIQHATAWRYLIYSEADFEVFRPAGATRRTDGGEIWHGPSYPPYLRSPPRCQISPPSVQRQGCRTPKTEIFTQIWPKCEILTPRRGASLARFSQNLQSLYRISGALAVKIWLDLLKGLWSYGDFKLRGSGYPQIFSAP